MEQAQSSRLKGFFALAPRERRKLLKTLVDTIDFTKVDEGLSLDEANMMSENVIATFSLPFSIACNFVVDERPVLVPMVTEEPSIVAASSKMAKIVAQNGGFRTEVDDSMIKGQIQFYGLYDIDKALAALSNKKSQLIKMANELCPAMVRRGGGVKEITFRLVHSKNLGPMLLVEPLMDVMDAMGANAINSMLEAFSQNLAPMVEGSLGVRILSNLCDDRLARARCTIDVRHFATDVSHDNGLFIAKKMIAAQALAEADIYRAATHNKGILNGIDAVALATGNDFRALEAGAHAYAVRGGHYSALTELRLDEEKRMLTASLSLPLACGVVGGISGFHAGVKLAHHLLGDFSKSAKKLSSVMVSVGLAQCLAALLALSQDGIQKGHMKLHFRKTQSLAP